MIVFVWQFLHKRTISYISSSASAKKTCSTKHTTCSSICAKTLIIRCRPIRFERICLLLMLILQVKLLGIGLGFSLYHFVTLGVVSEICLCVFLSFFLLFFPMFVLKDSSWPSALSWRTTEFQPHSKKSQWFVLIRSIWYKILNPRYPNTCWEGNWTRKM